MTIEQAIHSIKNKDQQGLLFLYDNYARALMGIIVRIVNSEQHGEEILQETFLKIWNKIDTFNPTKATLFTWMARIARNAAIDQKRLKKFEHISQTDSFDAKVHGESFSENHCKIDVERLTSKLDDKYKTILDHIYLLGYSHSETAEKLGLPIGTVKSRLRKAISILRENLKGEETIFASGIIFIWLFIQLLCS